MERPPVFVSAQSLGRPLETYKKDQGLRMVLQHQPARTNTRSIPKQILVAREFSPSYCLLHSPFLHTSRQMRFSILAVVAAFAGATLAQECNLCGSVVILGDTTQIGTCIGDTNCVNSFSTGVPRVASVSVGVSSSHL